MPAFDEFYTMKGYALHADHDRTSAMEDYVEMMFRIEALDRQVRVGELSNRLHVKASSATKMIQHLAQAGLVDAKKYGEVSLTESGRKLGSYLLYRHNVLHRFLCLLNHSANELEQAEKIEHYLDERTIRNLEQLNRTLEKIAENGPV